MFAVPIAEITYDVIEDFCRQRVEEGVRLDYKGDFPKDLAKLLAAFSNTYGGLILIGIDDNDRKPVLPIKGIPLQRGLAERITSIGLQGVYPPVFPEVRVCEFSSAEGAAPDRAVVVVRVHQSDQSPHAVENKTHVYLRVDSQSEPFQLATIDQIEWLGERRRDAVRLRRRLERLMAGHAAVLCRPTDSAEGKQAHERQLLREIIRVAPVFPGSPGGVVATPGRLLEMKKALSYPFITPNTPGVHFQTRRVEGGVGAFANSDTIGRYFEINEHGLVLYQRAQTEPSFAFDWFIGTLWEVLHRALAFYAAEGFFGLFDLEFKLTDLSRRDLGNPHWHSVDDSIVVSRRATVDEYRENALGVVTEMVNRVRWAFDLPDFSTEAVKQNLWP